MFFATPAFAALVLLPQAVRGKSPLGCLLGRSRPLAGGGMSLPLINKIIKNDTQLNINISALSRDTAGFKLLVNMQLHRFTRTTQGNRNLHLRGKKAQIFPSENKRLKI